MAPGIRVHLDRGMFISVAPPFSSLADLKSRVWSELEKRGVSCLSESNRLELLHGLSILTNVPPEGCRDLHVVTHEATFVLHA